MRATKTAGERGRKGAGENSPFHPFTLSPFLPCWLFLCLLLALRTPATAANHYVRGQATGSANTGATWANCWTNFASVVWTRGDTYFWAGGTNVEDLIIDVAEAGTTRVTLKKANVADNSGDAGWSAAYATSQAVLQGGIEILNSYITIDGVTNSGSSGYGIKIYLPAVGAGSAIINVADLKSFFTIGYVELQGPGFGYATGASGYKQNSFSGTVKGHHLHHLYFHGLSQNGFVFVNLLGTSFSDYGLLFENVILEDCGHNLADAHGQGIQGGSGAGGSSNSFWIIRNSTFHNIIGTAAMAWLGYSTNSDILIYNNVFWNTNQGFSSAGDWTNGSPSSIVAFSPGVIYVSSTAGSSTRMRVLNNTFYNMNRATIYFADAVTNNNEVMNNLFHTGHFGVVHIGVTVSSGNFGMYDDYYNCTTLISSGIYGVPYGETGQQGESADPCVSVVTGNFRLADGANAIGNGTNLSATFTTDHAGYVRSAPWDIGAFKFAPVADAIVGAGRSRSTGRRSGL